jgi:hypothetical protein
MSSISGCPWTGDYLVQTHIHKMEATGNAAHQNAFPTWTEVKILHKQQHSHIQSNTETNVVLWNTTLGRGFHFKLKNPRMFPI